MRYVFIDANIWIYALLESQDPAQFLEDMAHRQKIEQRLEIINPFLQPHF